MAGLSRRVETFVAGYVGFMSEGTAFTGLATTDLDGSGKQNFALTDRTKQYFTPNDTIVVKNSAVVVDPTTYTLQRPGGIVRMVAPLSGSPVVTIDGFYVPMYFLRGARNLGNNRTAQKIDTTGSGDSYMNAVPGRPDASFSFSLVTGYKVTNKASKVVTLESMLVNASQNGDVCVFSFIDDTTDPLLPRDAFYAFVGNANKTRQLNNAVERAIDGYISIPNDGTLPVASIDYIA